MALDCIKVLIIKNSDINLKVIITNFSHINKIFPIKCDLFFEVLTEI